MNVLGLDIQVHKEFSHCARTPHALSVWGISSLNMHYKSMLLSTWYAWEMERKMIPMVPFIGSRRNAIRIIDVCRPPQKQTKKRDKSKRRVQEIPCNPSSEIWEFTELIHKDPNPSYSTMARPLKQRRELGLFFKDEHHPLGIALEHRDRRAARVRWCDLRSRWSTPLLSTERHLRLSSRDCGSMWERDRRTCYAPLTCTRPLASWRTWCSARLSSRWTRWGASASGFGPGGSPRARVRRRLCGDGRNVFGEFCLNTRRWSSPPRRSSTPCGAPSYQRWPRPAGSSSWTWWRVCCFLTCSFLYGTTPCTGEQHTRFLPHCPQNESEELKEKTFNEVLHLWGSEYFEYLNSV